jgi:hypothetical protein
MQVYSRADTVSRHAHRCPAFQRGVFAVVRRRRLNYFEDVKNFHAANLGWVRILHPRNRGAALRSSARQGRFKRGAWNKGSSAGGEVCARCKNPTDFISDVDGGSAVQGPADATTLAIRRRSTTHR